MMNGIREPCDGEKGEGHAWMTDEVLSQTLVPSPVPRTISAVPHRRSQGPVVKVILDRYEKKGVVTKPITKLGSSTANNMDKKYKSKVHLCENIINF
jgi:hypothetical protein